MNRFETIACRRSGLSSRNISNEEISAAPHMRREPSLSDMKPLLATGGLIVPPTLDSVRIRRSGVVRRAAVYRAGIVAGALLLGFPFWLWSSPALANVITITLPASPMTKMAAGSLGTEQMLTGSTFKFIKPNTAFANLSSFAPGATAKTFAAKLLTQLQTDNPPKLKNNFTIGNSSDAAMDQVIAKNTGSGGIYVELQGPDMTPTGSISAFAKDDPTIAEVEFSGTFDEYDAYGNLSSFTAGFFADPTMSNPSGSDSLTLFSSSFPLLPDMSGPDLTGATIANTFAADLASGAASLGIVLDPVDLSPTDGLVVVNYPAGTATFNGGVVFGTTSPGGMLSGAINAVPEPGTLMILGVGLIGLGLARRVAGRRGVSPALRS